jgi:hypothetical protein
MDVEKYDDVEDFGTVRRYDHNLGGFVPEYLQSNIQTEEVGSWMESL